jgi:hypothetical protein
MEVKIFGQKFPLDGIDLNDSLSNTREHDENTVKTHLFKKIKKYMGIKEQFQQHDGNVRWDEDHKQIYESFCSLGTLNFVQMMR